MPVVLSITFNSLVRIQLSPHWEEIRLLCLSGEFWELEIGGKLVPIHIDELPNYECISYRWGDSTEEKTMSLDGRKLKISPSVYNILRHRRAFFSNQLIWIDSIYINQDDPIEKFHQVRTMHIIYTKAAQVTVCLGDSLVTRLTFSQELNSNSISPYYFVKASSLG